VKTKKTPHRKSGGTAKKTDRAAREAAVVANLEKIRERDPAAFTEMMRLLARLVDRARKRKVDQ
jgi:hypothetical protein